MSKKILFLFDKEFLQFGIAKNFEKKYDYELYGIVEGNQSLKQFFEKQKIVSFKKIWYFNDHINFNFPNTEYLKNFEKKYNIDLWHVLYMEKTFYQKYNKYYKFNYEEILSIVEKECKFFEEVLDEIKPDYFLSNIITQQQSYLLSRICKAKNISVLSEGIVRFGDRFRITDGLQFDIHENIDLTGKKYPKKSENEINEFLKSYKPRNASLDLDKRGNTELLKNSPNSNYKASKFEKIKAVLDFIFLKKYEHYDYTSYGRTKFNVMIKGNSKLNKVIKKSRKKFIDKFFTKDIQDKQPFVYFPLHVEPEISLLMGAPYYTDQFSVITNIAKSIPINYKLLVKEHPGQEEHGWRESEFYKKILELPNVFLIHPSITSDEIISKSSLVFTIRGTASLEAVFHKKPSIVFHHEDGYTTIPSIKIIKNFSEIPQAIKESLEKEVKLEDLSDFINYIQENSFEFPHQRYSLEVAKKLNYVSGFLKEGKLDQETINKFLNEYGQIFEMLSIEYIKKIHESK
jgi:hypothetical protein